MNKSGKKINDSALRVLEVLKLMINNDYSKEELLDIISENTELEAVHRTETLNKYFSTYKFLGANLSKSRDKYRLDRVPMTIKLQEDEIETFLFLFEYAKNICVSEDYAQLEKLANNIAKYLDEASMEKVASIKENIRSKYERYLKFTVSKELVDTYEKYCKDKLKLKVTYNNSALDSVQSFVVEPKEVIITQVGCILRAYNPYLAEIQDFYTSNIVECTQLPNRASTTEPMHSVTFKLTGRLAHSYELKEGERVTQYLGESKEDFHIVVTNTLEDKTTLMKRLLRYGTACEVLFPSTFKQQMQNQLCRIRAIYQ